MIATANLLRRVEVTLDANCGKNNPEAHFVGEQSGRELPSIA
jgi:hypothetical protein